MYSSTLDGGESAGNLGDTTLSVRAHDLGPRASRHIAGGTAVLAGRAYFLLGDYLNSMEFLLRALSIAPDYAPAHLHLGILYVTTGERENGRLEFQRVIQLDGDGQFGLFAKQLLAQYFP